MMSRVWRAGVLVALLGLVGCASGDGTIPTLPMPTASTGPESLVGPEWSLESISGKSVIAGTTLTAAFSSEERVSGSAGCNRYFGSVRVAAGSLSVGPLASTMMACGQDGAMEQERLYLASLQAATSYTIQGHELRLGPSASQVTLVFASR
jgi:heat shock protein HslJ